MEQHLSAETYEAAGVGHNNPPSREEEVQGYLLSQTQDLRQRYDELIAASARIPTECQDDETAGKLSDMIKLVSACAKTFETKRIGEKEPYLTLSRAVDGFFKKYTENLDTAKRTVSRPLEMYLKRKEDEKREAARKLAAEQRAEAERRAQEARELEQANMPKAAEQAMKEAVRIDERAAKDEKKAEAKPAELARTRGDYGSLSTLRTSWVGKIIDKENVDLEKLRPFISEDVLQKLINAAVKAGFREIRGVHISEESVVQVR